jgi:hypothetical protein
MRPPNFLTRCAQRAKILETTAKLAKKEKTMAELMVRW